MDRYILPATFLLLSVVFLFSKPLIEKVLLKLFLRDEHLSRMEKLFTRLSIWVTYLLSVIFLNISIIELPISRNNLEIINRFFFSFYVIIGTLIALKVLDIIIEKLVENAQKRIPSSQLPLIRTYFAMISKLLKIVVVVIAAIAILNRFGFNVESLVASLGVGSLAVGLAAQDTIKNFISGILLVTDRQFRIGDWISIKDLDIEGRVYDIGLRTTKIVTISGNNLITVPNSKLTEGVIENMLYPSPNVKDCVNIGVAYGTDIEKAKKLMLESTKDLKGILPEPPPSVYFTEFADSSLNLKLIYYVADKDIAFGVKSLLHERINKTFKENGIEIPFPQNDVWFRNPMRIEKNQVS